MGGNVSSTFVNTPQDGAQENEDSRAMDSAPNKGNSMVTHHWKRKNPIRG